MNPIPGPKPNATVTIEPLGPRSGEPRDHSIKVAIRLSMGGGDLADAGHALRVARAALRAFPPAAGEPDRRQYVELAAARRTSKSGMTSTVIGVEGSAVWPARPDDDALAALRVELVSKGYRVAIRERRECAEPGCTIDAIVDWERPGDVSQGWYSARICGRHNYRTCSRCKSVHALSSSSFAGPAPSVHCDVCGLIIIEWGGSKLWTSELVKRGEGWKPDPPAE